MQIIHRPSAARMHRKDDWKTSAYAFVPYQTHFGELCGFADDVVAPGQGFGMHPHRDMEITTVMLRGAQRHEDSTGERRILEANAVQTMSAGAGIRHSEGNASAEQPFHSYQIWVYPRHPGGPARYETFRYEPEARRGRFLLALSPDRREGSALIGQDAFFSLATLDPGTTIPYELRGTGNGAYVHCARGEVSVAGHRLGAGDAAGIWDTASFELEVLAEAELVVVEVPMQRGVRV